MNDITVSKEEWEALKKDKQRLDFLENCHTKLNEKYGTDYGWEVIINHNVVRMFMKCSRGLWDLDMNDSAGGNNKIKTCRKAIDEKIKEFERMKKELISLEEHNKNKSQAAFPTQPTLNGIACPKCGVEMYDSQSNVILTSYPPKKSVHCEKCGHKDYAFV